MLEREGRASQLPSALEEIGAGAEALRHLEVQKTMGVPFCVSAAPKLLAPGFELYGDAVDTRRLDLRRPSPMILQPRDVHGAARLLDDLLGDGAQECFFNRVEVMGSDDDQIRLQVRRELNDLSPWRSCGQMERGAPAEARLFCHALEHRSACFQACPWRGSVERLNDVHQVDLSARKLREPRGRPGRDQRNRRTIDCGEDHGAIGDGGMNAAHAPHHASVVPRAHLTRRASVRLVGVLRVLFFRKRNANRVSQTIDELRHVDVGEVFVDRGHEVLR